MKKLWKQIKKECKEANGCVLNNCQYCDLCHNNDIIYSIPENWTKDNHPEKKDIKKIFKRRKHHAYQETNS